jgi:hypothetical protein
MRRFAHCLILLMAPSAAVWADDAFTQSHRGACVYADNSTSATAAPVTPRAPARPAVSNRAPRAAETGGGGGSEDDLMQRMRAPRWHSFLPGMFR